MTPRLIGRVWITRAEPGASRTAARLADRGLEPVIAPLLKIRSIPQAAPDLTGVSALAFTSANGVAAFAALTYARALPVFAVGDATAGAALEAGFDAVRSAGGDLGDLARLIRAGGLTPGAVILHPAAREPAGDLAAAVGDAAVVVRALPVYEAVETAAAPPEAFDAVLVHSPRAGRALAAALPGAAAAGRLAVAISGVAAAPLASLPFAVVVAARPDEAALLAALTAALGKRRSRV